ncbi:hypothetical protein TNCV_2897851 [Trichonephila clavipes]|nr:hypothetical protein TNCV_2897851 [Trichonephila clavipes]
MHVYYTSNASQLNVRIVTTRDSHRNFFNVAAALDYRHGLKKNFRARSNKSSGLVMPAEALMILHYSHRRFTHTGFQGVLEVPRSGPWSLKDKQLHLHVQSTSHDM